MALAVLNATLGVSLGEGRYKITLAPDADVVAADTTDVAAAIAVLVADGASPTQAHVTTLNNAWTTLLAAITALNGAAADSADLKIIVNQATITTPNQFLAIFRAIQHRLTGTGILTG